MKVNELIDLIVFEYSKILNEHLVGIYLHGSLAMGCFQPSRSDIDFLVVVDDMLSATCMRSLVDVLLDHADDAPQKGFEMSVIHRNDAALLTHPTPFILHYSNAHRENYLHSPDYICGGWSDPDLAAHIMVINKRGIRLYGDPIDAVFMPVPKKYYIESIVSDIAEAKDAILINPTYYILNLCRVVYYLKEEVVSSKKEGGIWGCQHLPAEYRELIQFALNDYESITDASAWETDRCSRFAAYMLEQVKNYLNDTVE